MSQQPPFQPSNQPPNQPPFQPPSGPPSYDAPTQAPGQAPWAQQPSPYGQQPGYPGAGGPPYGGAGGSGGSGKKPWGLVIGALVAGLVVGGGVAGGVVALTAGDPKDSDEYQALSDDLDEARASLSSAPGGDDSTPEPSPSESESTDEGTDGGTDEGTEDGSGGSAGATQDVDGWTVTEPEVSEDGLGDFQATMQATNDTGEPAIAYFQVVVSKGSEQLTEMFCADESAEEVDPGATVDISCFTSDDYTDDYDSVVVQAGF